MSLINGTAAGEDLVGTTGTDLIYGRGGDDSIWGSDGFDEIYGGTGNDTIADSAGADFLDGGRGFDTISMFFGTFFGESIAGFEYHFAIGAEHLTPEGGSAVGFEAVNITGGDFNDTIFGGRNDDLVRGWMGDDELDGGRGDDFMIGDNGVDTIRGGGGNDFISGGGHDDVLYGGDGDDTLRGGAIFDLFQGSDTMEGGRGADTFWSGPNGTTITYANSREGIYLNVDLKLGFGGDAQGDVILAGGATYIIASEFDDYLVGGLSEDGAGGNDRLQHSYGTRTITGGEGLDQFIFVFDGRYLYETPTVMDFDQAGGETLDLSLVDAKPKRSGDQAFAFIGTDPFDGTYGQLRYEIDDVNDRTLVQFNGHLIILAGEFTLTEDDFVL